MNNSPFKWNFLVIVLLLILILAPVIAYRYDKVKWVETHDSRQQISFLSPSGFGTNPNYDSEDHYTVYMPSECRGRTVIRLKYASTLKIGDDIYHNNDRIGQFTPGEDLDFELYENDKKCILSGKMAFYYAEYVPSMYLETDSGSMHSVDDDYYHNTGEGAYYHAVDNDLNITEGRCSIQGRGNTTWYSTDKKPYNIDCSVDTSFFGMPPQKEWCLLANFFDGSEIRNWIALNTARNIGMPIACECEYVNLYLNGQYAGLYLLTQHIDVSGGNVPVHDLNRDNKLLKGDPGNHDLYYDIENRLDTRDSQGRFISYYEGKSPGNISGGYLLEFMAIYVDESARIATDRINIVVESPKYPTLEEAEYISEYVNCIEDDIYDLTDDSYLRYIDMDSWARMFLLEDFFANEDTDRFSLYMYKDRDDDRLFCGPAWDFDISMGVSRTDRQEDSARSEWLKDRSESLSGLSHKDLRDGWLFGLYDCHIDFREAVAQKFTDELYPVVKKELDEDIPLLEERIRSSALMDYVLFPGECRPEYEQGFEYENEYLNKWLAERLEFCSRYYTDYEG